LGPHSNWKSTLGKGLSARLSQCLGLIGQATARETSRDGWGQLTSIAAKRIVNRGSGYEEEFFTYKFPPAARFDALLSGPQPLADTSAPDAEALEEIFRTELVKRLPRVE
jgi:hypothetical protein